MSATSAVTVTYSRAAGASAAGRLTDDGRYALQDLYLAVNGTVLPVVGPQAPMHATVATAAVPPSCASPQQRSASSTPPPSAVGAAPASAAAEATVLRSRIGEWYCPACLTVPKRSTTDGRCNFCFQCPECPGGVLTYRSRPKASNLTCNTCAWSSRDNMEHSKDVGQRWHAIRQPTELETHLAATRGIVGEALSPFTTAAAGTEGEAEERRAAAAAAGTSVCNVRDKDIADRHRELLARLKLGSAARAAHLTSLARASGAETAREMTAPGKPFPDPAHAVPVSVEMLAGVNPRNHPSVLQLSLQERGRDQPLAQRGVLRFGAAPVAEPTSPKAPVKGRLGDAAPPLRLVGVPLKPRGHVEGVLASEAASPTARVTNIARLAALDVVTAPPDSKLGHDYAYRVLSLKSEGGDPESLNAARYLPQLRVCPLYADAPEDPAKAAAEGRPPPNPQPTATRVSKHPKFAVERPVYDVGLYLEAALKSQVTTVSAIMVVPELCHKCTVHSSLPTFGGDSSGPKDLTLQQRSEVPPDALYRYGVYRGDLTATQPRNAPAAAASGTTVFTSVFRNVVPGCALANPEGEAFGLQACILDVGHRAAFIAAVVDERTRPESESMRIAFRVEAEIGGVPVSYIAHVEVKP